MTREELWRHVFLFCLTNDHSLTGSGLFADAALREYDERFPQPKPPAIEEPVKLEGKHFCAFEDH